jgi:hypothetical protein
VAPGAALVLVTCLASVTHAKPIEGRGSAEIEGQGAKARDRAIGEARTEALEQALSSLGVTTDPAALAQVRAHPESWTGAYRVLGVTEEAGRVEVEIEVEIDIPRLRKRVAASGQDSQHVGGFRWGRAKIEGCGSVAADRIRAPLQAYGIVADRGDSSLSLELRCHDRGGVAHTHVHAAVVEITAETEGGVELRRELSAWGFAPKIEDATEIALDRSIADLADELAADARGDLEIVVEQPWPAGRVAVLESSLREAVMGVDAVELAGITAGGAVVLRVAGSVDAEGLARGLQGLSFPGFSLVGLRVDDAHTLRVRMQ